MIRTKSRNVEETEKVQNRLGCGIVVGLLLAFLLAFGATGTAAAQTDISGCTTPPISTSGSYEITNDIDTSSGPPCIDVAVDDVVIDGNGNRINSTVSGTVGLNVQPFGAITPANVTVKNLTITNFDTGAKIENSEDVTLTNVETESTKTGILVKESPDVTVEGATISDTDTGVDVRKSDDVTVNESSIYSTELFTIIDPDPIFDPFPPGFPTLSTSTVGTQSHGGSGPGILLNETQGAVVEDNTVSNFEEQGVLVSATTPSTGSNEVADNELINNSQGVVVSATADTTSPNQVLDNELTANSLGIGVAGFTTAPTPRNEVSGNELTDNTYGIYVVSQEEDVIDNTVTNSTQVGMQIASEDAEVSENTVTESGIRGIQVQGGSFNSLTDNIVEDNGEAGIKVGGTSGFVADNTTLVNNTATGNQTYGIWLNETDDNELRENEANGNDAAGIYLNGTSTGNEIEDNTANDNGEGFTGGAGVYGIWLDEESSDNEVVDNEASDNGIGGSSGVPSAGIYLRGSSGLSIASSTGDVSNNTVVDNTVTGAQPTPTQKYGIWLSGADDNEVRDNTANENVESGIYLDGESAENEIRGNTANDNGYATGGGGGTIGTYGIWLEGGSSDNEVVNNEAFDNGVGGSGGSGGVRSAGIYLGGAGPIGPGSVENNTVEKNTVGSEPSGNQSYGIWLVGANKNEVLDNVAEDNNEAGIYLGGTIGSIEVKNNKLVNNTARGSEYGIWLSNAFDNDVSESLVEDNEEGITVEEVPFTTLGDVETESVSGSGNTFTDDVSRNNDWDFVVETEESGGTLYTTSSSGYPVTNLSIGASTAPDTTLSFDAKEMRLGSVDSPEPDPDDSENISRYFEAEQLDTDGFLDISLSYEDDDVAGVNESTLELQRFVGTEWVTVPDTSLDKESNRLGVNVTGFGASDFGAFGESDVESPVDGVSDELWAAVTGQDDEDGLSLSDLGDAIQAYQDNPSDADIDGVTIRLSDLGDLIQYYRNVVV